MLVIVQEVSNLKMLPIRSNKFNHSTNDVSVTQVYDKQAWVCDVRIKCVQVWHLVSKNFHPL
jgi:hypothetical protein